MRAFLRSFIACTAVEIVATLYCLAYGRVPRRTPGGMAFNAAFVGAFALWAAHLLNGL